MYVRADGISRQARLEDGKPCIVVLIGATPGPTKASAEAGFDALIGYQIKYQKAAERLNKHRDALLTFTPPKHWGHLRTSLIETTARNHAPTRAPAEAMSVEPAPRSPWPSGSLELRRKLGDASAVIASCQTDSRR